LPKTQGERKAGAVSLSRVPSRYSPAMAAGRVRTTWHESCEEAYTCFTLRSS
jgi:hypothetical protein